MINTCTGGSDSDEPDSPDPRRVEGAQCNIKKPSQSSDTKTDKGIHLLANSIISEFFLIIESDKKHILHLSWDKLVAESNNPFLMGVIVIVVGTVIIAYMHYQK